MYRQEKKYYRKAFLIALIMAVVLLLPFVIIDGGYFVYYGDYNAQQIPFYKLCINAVQSGNMGWSWQTDLGANFVGSYSFYTLGSPFFWFAALFPVSISQYLMAPLLALKIALCSLFAFIYIRRFVTNPDNALIGGILYAFSGFSLYNIFFNHFHEAIVFFPLLLIGLEEAVVNKRRGAFAVAVAINAFVNYFFFIGECIFLVIYFVVRLCMSKEFRISVADFFCLACESILGVMLAGILFVPSIYQVLDVPRSTQILNGWNFLFYGNQSRYGLILEGMFFPPEIPARTNMFTEANAKWSSVALYLPLFSMAGVIAFVKGAKKHWARVLLPICLVMAFIPGLNAAFVLFNSNFYTRWFYMPELICCLATVYTLEHSEIDLKFGWKACCIVSGLMTALALFFPMTRTTEIKNEDGVTEKVKDIVPRIMNEFNPAVLVNIVLCAAMLVVLGIVIHQRKKLSSVAFRERLLTVTIICSMMLGYYFVAYGRILGPYIGSYNKSVNAKIDIDDIEFYRIEAPDEMNNVNMLWNMSSLQSFTSIIPSSTFELYDLLDIERTVNSKPETTHYALRSLTRVKYLILPSDYLEVKREGVLEDLRTFSFLKSENGYDVYENEYVMPMGTAYDEYVLTDDVKKASQGELLMIGSVALTDEQAEKFSDLLTPVRTEDLREGSLTYERFKTEVAERNELSVIQFSVNNSGFTAMTNYNRERLVAFSVPFDNGWSATVSGEPVEIEKVNGGFMGIRVGAGVKEIEFTYKTPGLSLGIILTVAGAVILAVYLVVVYVFRRSRPNRYVHLYPQEQVRGVKAHSAYIEQLARQIYESPDKQGKKSETQTSLEWPDVEEQFMDRKKYDFSKRKPKKRTSHITEDDEAYRVLKELEEQKKDELK